VVQIAFPPHTSCLLLSSYILVTQSVISKKDILRLKPPQLIEAVGLMFKIINSYFYIYAFTHVYLLYNVVRELEIFINPGITNAQKPMEKKLRE